MIKCTIFDLDGVIVDTAKYHLLAWQRLACELGFEFTQEDGEATKGVSRMASLDIVLRKGGMESRFSNQEKEMMATTKNNRYLEYVNNMSSDELLVGVKPFILSLKKAGIIVVLGSASKNARYILERVGIESLFDYIVDGNVVSKAKPDPEVFVKGAQMAGVKAEECVVFEDAEAGVEAAINAGMRCVGVGSAEILHKATTTITSFEGYSVEKLLSSID